MKDKFFLHIYIYLLAIIPIVLITSCDAEEKDPLIAPSVFIDRLITASSNELVMVFTPSESTVRFEYAIGDESDLNNFLSGSMSGIKEVEGNDKQSITFSDLDENKEYSIFARAYNADGKPGPVAAIRTRTRKPINNFEVNRRYLTSNSVAFTVKSTSEYYKFDFALGKESDKEIFESGAIDGFETKQDISEYTANYFLLSPSTSYTFFVRGYDRQSGQVSETREYQFTTSARGTVPSIDFDIKYQDLYSGDYTFTPNEHCGKFSVFISLKDEYKNIIEDEMTWRGDMLDMLESWTKGSYIEISKSAGGPLAVSEVTGSLINGLIADPFGYPMEAYALLYDKENKIYGVEKFEFQSTSYNENVGEAKAELKITNITKNGAFYEFFPNEHAMGILFETFDAEWYENLLQSPSYYDGYIENFLFYTQGGWIYTHGVISATVPERSAESGRRYYVCYLPMNFNGPNSGWGKLQKVMYQTLPE